MQKQQSTVFANVDSHEWISSPPVNTTGVNNNRPSCVHKDSQEQTFPHHDKTTGANDSNHRLTYGENVMDECKYDDALSCVAENPCEWNTVPPDKATEDNDDRPKIPCEWTSFSCYKATGDEDNDELSYGEDVMEEHQCSGIFILLHPALFVFKQYSTCSKMW